MTEFIPAFLISYTDSSFTNPHEVLRPDEPENRKGSFTHMGARYWGFESKRHKATRVNAAARSFIYDHEAHEVLHIGFHAPASLSSVKVSTRWFTGNQVPCISVDLLVEGDWQMVLERVVLEPDREHGFEFDPAMTTEARIRCYHEGGISRINFFGEAGVADERVNLLVTADISYVSNDHFGKPRDAVLGERGVDHMVGWESARTGFGEQAVFSLAAPARIQEFVVDTYLHRLNPPLSCHVYALPAESGLDLAACYSLRPCWSVLFDDGRRVVPEDFQAYMLGEAFLDEPVSNNRQFSIQLHLPTASPWRPLVAFGELQADTFHRFTAIEYSGAVAHILYMHYPNGGVHGLKAFADKAAQAV